MWAHAKGSRDEYSKFWNYFSAFALHEARYVDDVEGILIASIPSQNAAVRRLRRIPLLREIKRNFRRMHITDPKKYGAE